MATFDEGERSKLYQKKALDLILNNPEQLIRQTFNRFLRYWTVLPRHDSNSSNSNGMKEQVAGVFYLFIFVLGIASLCLTLLRGRKIQLLFIAILWLPIPYYLKWFTHFRYRFPIEPILMVFAGYAIYLFCKLVKRNALGISC